MQVARYGLPRDPSSLDSYVRGDDVTADGSFVWAKAADGATDVIKFTFGKHKGEPEMITALCKPSRLRPVSQTSCCWRLLWLLAAAVA